MSEKYLGENSTPLLINQIKENCTQKRSTLPIASIDELGNTYQYTGTTSGSLVHGYFYECVSDGQDPATYSWELIGFNPSSLGTAAFKNSTDRVAPNNTGLVESQSVYSAIQTALSSIYTPAGEITCAELTSSLLISDNVGKVYELSDSGTTTALFLQGAGKPLAIGDNVGIISAGPGRILFNLMANRIDLSTFQKKVLTSAVESQTTVEGALGALSTNKQAKSLTTSVEGATTVEGALGALSENKVAKVTGKGLSTNDYDNTEKGKVANAIQKSQTAGLVKNDGTVDTTAYAKQSEMSVTAGTGADADKTTIQLKTGTSATVLKTHQDISGKADKVSGATNGDIATLDANGNLVDSGKTISDVVPLIRIDTTSDSATHGYYKIFEGSTVTASTREVYITGTLHNDSSTPIESSHTQVDLSVRMNKDGASFNGFVSNLPSDFDIIAVGNGTNSYGIYIKAQGAWLKARLKVTANIVGSSSEIITNPTCVASISESVQTNYSDSWSKVTTESETFPKTYGASLDANNCTESGYYANVTFNVPVNGYGFSLFAELANSMTYCHQTAKQFIANDEPSVTYVRKGRYLNNAWVWSSWEKLVTESEFKSYGIKTIWTGSKTKGDTGMNFDASPYDLCFAQVGGTWCRLISGNYTGSTGRKKFSALYAGRDYVDGGTYEQYYLLDIAPDGTIMTCGWFDISAKDTQNSRLAAQKALDLAIAGTSTWSDPIWRKLSDVETSVTVSKIIGIKFQAKS